MHTYIQAGSNAIRQTDRHIEIHITRKTNIQTYSQAKRQTADRQTYRQTDSRHTYIQTDTQTYRQRDRQTDRQSE